MSDQRYKELDEAIIRLAITLNPDSRNYQMILDEGKSIRNKGSEPVYFLDVEDQSVFVLDYNDIMQIVEEDKLTIN